MVRWGCRLRSATLMPVLCAALLPAVAADQYRVRIIELPPPFRLVHVNGINNRGDLLLDLARFELQPGRAMILTSEGEQIQITAPGGLDPYPTAFNGAREVVGTYGRQGDLIHGAFYWTQAGGPVEIENPLSDASMNPAAINDRGDVIGYFAQAAFPIASFRWHTGQPARVLHKNGFPRAINNAGMTVGRRFAAKPYGTSQSAVIQQPGHAPVMPLFEPVDQFTYSSGAEDVNSRGTVVMYQYRGPFAGEVTLWNRDLGTMGLGFDGHAAAINDRDEVIGSVAQGEYVWRSDHGLVLLRDALAPGSPQLPGFYVTCINDHGVIAGRINEAQNAIVVFTPVE